MPYTTYGLLKTIRSHQISSPSVQGDARDRPAERLQPVSSRQDAGVDRRSTSNGGTRRRGHALDADEQSVAASLLWLLKGDAGQRAIVAQSMGWAPAQQASGTGWMAPYLALMQKDRVRRRASHRGAIARHAAAVPARRAAAQPERAAAQRRRHV